MEPGSARTSGFSIKTYGVDGECRKASLTPPANPRLLELSINWMRSPSSRAKAADPSLELLSIMSNFASGTDEHSDSTQDFSNSPEFQLMMATVVFIRV